MNILQKEDLDMSENRHLRHQRHHCNEIEQGFDFILSHFVNPYFPRAISTKTTERRQILVDSEDEALARFKQANYMDCRIAAYSKFDIIGDPNFIFIDLDITNKYLLDRILDDRFKAIEAHPTVLFTGNGYHIYQPINSVCLDENNQLRNSCSYSEPSKEFLKFAEKYLSNNLSDSSHNASFNSCMVRIPNSINSKNNVKVQVIQEWDGKRPDIRLLLGSFYAWLLTQEKKHKEIIENNPVTHTGKKRKWIEDRLLKTALGDYRKTTVNLVLAPYLINTRKLSFEEATNIILQWLELCRIERPLDFNAKRLVNNALKSVRKSGYKPMSLNTLKQKNHMVLETLFWEDYN